MNMAAVCTEFLDYCQLEKHLSANTLIAYKQDLGEYLAFRGGRTDSVTGGEVIVYVQYLQITRSLSPATIKRRIACLRALFKCLVRQNVLSVSPFAGLDLRIAVPKRLPRCLQGREISALASATARTPATTRLATLLLFATGVRISELSSVRLRDVDVEKRAIRIYGKGSRERVVFLPNDSLGRMITRYIKTYHRKSRPTDRLLLNRHGHPASAACLRARLKALAYRCGIDRSVTPHMIRHTAATLLLEAGVDIRFVQRLLGHQSIATTQIYTHVSDAALRSAISKANVCGTFPGMRS